MKKIIYNIAIAIGYWFFYLAIMTLAGTAIGAVLSLVTMFFGESYTLVPMMYRGLLVGAGLGSIYAIILAHMTFKLTQMGKK